MPVNWEEVHKVIFPIKSYEDLCNRLEVSYSFAFIRRRFNFTLPELADYTKKLLGGDPRNRYTEYVTQLLRIIGLLENAAIHGLIDLKTHTGNREQLENFVQQSNISPRDIGALLKYLVYWVVPGEKYLSGLVGSDFEANLAVKSLSTLGIRTNLQLLERGITPEGRKALAESAGVWVVHITDLVNRADFSRMPWASKATISNIIGAGYGSLAQLARANPDKLYADFYTYGRKIGKNLKLGNEIQSSYRIAQIVPALVENN